MKTKLTLRFSTIINHRKNSDYEQDKVMIINQIEDDYNCEVEIVDEDVTDLSNEEK